MTSPGERIARTEGILEQINERLGNIERMLGLKADRNETNERISNLERKLDQKSDKSEMRFLLATTITLLVAVIGLLGAVLARI